MRTGDPIPSNLGPLFFSIYSTWQTMRIIERVSYILLIQSENSHVRSISTEIHPYYRTALRLHYKLFARNL